MTLSDPKLLANIRIVLTRTSHPGNIGGAARAMDRYVRTGRATAPEEAPPPSTRTVPAALFQLGVLQKY